ncbi:MAG: metallophosphoesterase [Clostridiales bacterium]|nr:metallophosphoesterase [Clostridiales bacterium]
MYRILVCSDIHRCLKDFELTLEAAAKEGPIDKILIAGDLELPPDKVSETIYNCKAFSKTPDIYMVKGNCDDYNCGLKDELVIDGIPGGHKIFLVHGHRYQVKSDLMILAMMAKTKGCDIAVFGHTHIYCDKTAMGVRLLNPGAVLGGYYGIPGFAILTIDGEGRVDFVHMAY